ncbi:hypothetical protein LP420_04030 [Massilia sp. B-10]|nr:hypothetical protein LP420_04030 [Massilia sp. B-10]
MKYGMVEVRLATPSLDTGLWLHCLDAGREPAELAAQRRDRHHGNGAPRRLLPGCGDQQLCRRQRHHLPAGRLRARQRELRRSTAWNTKSYYVAPTSMANRFITYRLYWTESQMRFTAVDNGVEHNLYDNVLPVNSTSLQEPFYLLLNLAVGGNFT